MLRLLTIEFYKIRHNKASKILTLIYFGLLCGLALLAAIRFDFGDFTFDITTTGFFNFPYIWHANTYIAAALKFFLLLVIISMITNEYSHRTLKQNLIDGLSKKEFVISKFLTIIALALLSTLFVFIVSLILGLLYSDFTEISIIFIDIQYIFAFFVKLLGFFSLGLFMGIWIKRSAFAVGAVFVWWIVEGLTKLIIALSLAFSGQEKQINSTIEGITRYFPLESMSNLIKEPWSRIDIIKTIANAAGEQFSKNYNVQWLDVFIVLIWTSIFIYGSYALLKKRDL